MYLVITIDTEEDNWGEYARDRYTVENLARLPRLQRIFDRHGVRPTYLISHPVAASDTAVEILGGFHEAGQCEIGAHCHPWNTPPLDEERNAMNSFITRLPAELQYKKLAHLHQTIIQNFGVVPRSFRSGRWGFGDSIAQHLIKLGYSVDSSVSPAMDWSEYGGPDYSSCNLQPYIYEMEAATGVTGGRLLELPATVDFLQGPDAIARPAYWTLNRNVTFGREVLAALRRLRAINHVCLSPELDEASEMIRLTKALMRREQPVVNMFFHSPSLLEGCSPFVQTAAEVESFFDSIETFVGFAVDAGLRPVTLSELDAAQVGATEVRLLESKPSLH